MSEPADMFRQADELPFVDEHTMVIAASPDVVWTALSATLDSAFSRPAAVMYARLVGCADEGGFHVAAAVPTSQLDLLGRHRFSSYALIFHIEEIGPNQSRIRAETRASFPGVHGAVYRMVVIGTRSHVASVRRLLASIRRAAESRPQAGVEGARALLPEEHEELRLSSRGLACGAVGGRRRCWRWSDG